MLRPLSGLFPSADYRALIVGLAEPDDAAVYQLDEERAIISTVDFFPPVVDDAYAFGAIAAANALSDVYAMGGEPLMAINLAAFPDGLDMELLTEILRGGAEKVREAGAVIAGGHTVTDKEPKYGLAVTGLAHPQRLLTKGGMRPGDKLILTKALGTGVVTTALKNKRAETAHVNAAVASMSRLNRAGARAALAHGVRGATDITGYGLLGHAHEMAHLSHVDLEMSWGALAWLPGAAEYAQQEIFAGGMWRNRDYFSQWVQFDSGIEAWQQYLLYDPQTSGGLLLAAAPETADGLCDTLRNGGDLAMLVGEARAGQGRIEIRL
ncbi:MAG: selenide, water dikinase SelD [Chloroflexi bacterium]|nr:selenide, water dikinase SelD [Chloroflexota bacterium]